MILKKCYISSFGKIKDFTIDFKDDLTVINHENGWGKTTLASFIKAMFYGLRDGKRSVAENERLKYRPWNSTERFGGYAIIERSGNEYKIERFFGAKQSEDTVTVTDVKTGKTFNTAELGKKFFQIDDEGFLSTAYFTQKDFEIKSNASLTAKYNETYSLSDAEQFEKTLSLLEAKAKEYKKTGDKGLINENKREIRDLLEKIEKAKLCSKTSASLKKEAEELELQLESLKKEVDAVSGRVALAGKKEALLLKKQNYQKIQREYDELKEKDKGFKGLFNGNESLVVNVPKHLEDARVLGELSVRGKGLVSDLETFENLAKDKPKKKDKTTPFSLAFTLTFLIASIIFFFISFPVGIALIVPTVICAFIFLSSLLKKGGGSGENSPLDSMFLDKKNELQICREKIEEIKASLTGFLSNFNLTYESYEEALKMLATAYNDYIITEKQLKGVTSELEEIKKDKEIFSETIGVEDVNSLKIKLARLNGEYSDKAGVLALKKARISTLEREGERLREYEENLSDLREKSEEYASEVETLILTLDFLKKADENLKVKYRAPLQNSLTKFADFISDKKIDAQIDVDLKVTVDNLGASRDVEYYSKGYKNLIEICKRFALIEVLFTADKPFVILDDPFVNLDDNKLNSALDLIKKLSKEYQIIYFVCHDSRSV